jgi:hypothetical protein
MLKASKVIKISCGVPTPISGDETNPDMILVTRALYSYESLQHLLLNIVLFGTGTSTLTSISANFFHVRLSLRVSLLNNLSES